MRFIVRNSERYITRSRQVPTHIIMYNKQYIIICNNNNDIFNRVQYMFKPQTLKH